MVVYSTVHANLSLTLYFSYELQVERFLVHQLNYEKTNATRGRLPDYQS